MSQPSPNSGGPTSKINRITRGETEANTRTRVQRRVGLPRPQEPAPSAPATGSGARYKFFPAFWTVASAISLAVNLVLLGLVLVLLPIIGKSPFQAEDQFAGLLGGLYNNFVKMDEATISADMPVDTTIPLNIVVPVQTTTRITLAEPATISNAHVIINTGGVDIDADAVVTLPAGTPLTVALDFPLTVQNTIPIQLNVPVNIPLRNTQLHEPFVGLQDVVKPYYCLVEPNAVWNNVQICSPLSNP